MSGSGFTGVEVRRTALCDPTASPKCCWVCDEVLARAEREVSTVIVNAEPYMLRVDKRQNGKLQVRYNPPLDDSRPHEWHDIRDANALAATWRAPQ